MICPNCGKENQEGFNFCIRCGQPLPQAVVPPDGMGTTVAPQPPMPAPIAPQQPPGYGMAPQQSHPPAGGYYQPAPVLLSIWGPFAGYGTRRRHLGWLMDDCGNRARDLLNRIGEKFHDRQIPSTIIKPDMLVARGVVVESRPYYILRRGLVSMALYVAQFGQDLFISLASYLKPPISNFRVIVIAAMTVVWFFSTFILPSIITGAISTTLGGFSLLGGYSGNSSGLGGALLFWLCIFGPLAAINNLALGLFLLYSIYKWLKEKDFLAGLRSAPNEFNEDDLMAMEKSVEQTVRICLDELGMNPDNLKPVTNMPEGRII